MPHVTTRSRGPAAVRGTWSPRVVLRYGPDTLRSAAVFAVKQTVFGIRPYRGGPAGTIRVAEQVTFDIDAVAVREVTP
jgi:hypothetical protein